MSEKTISRLFTWRSAIADAGSGLPPLSRLVALTLSLHMSERGDSCFPSQQTLMEETGMGKTALNAHLARLEADGWLVRETGGGRGKNGRGIPTQYKASIPVRPQADTTEGDPAPGSEEPAGQEQFATRTVEAGSERTVRLATKNSSPGDQERFATRTQGRQESVIEDDNDRTRDEIDTPPSSSTGSSSSEKDPATHLAELCAEALYLHAPNTVRARRPWCSTTAATIALERADEIAELITAGVPLLGAAQAMTNMPAATIVAAARCLKLPVSAEDAVFERPATVISIEARQSASMVAALVQSQGIEAAEEWIETDCPPGARDAAVAELNRRTGRTAS